ncbi:MAG: methylglutaconyl-CoA hydratase, partial [Cytophagales bacterium CG18_big_fil_WC_8_21_14_2_50_42_9]
MMELVEYYNQNQVGYITLNRPARQNALNPDLVQQLKAAFTQAEADAACKVIVLKAKGEVFCVGADLHDGQTADTNAITPDYDNASQLPALLQQIYTSKKVVIAQVQGPAISDGGALAAVCDLVF